MKITGNKNIKPKSSLIILGKKETDFSFYFDSEAESLWFKEQLDKKVNFFSFNRYQYRLFIQIIRDNEKLSSAENLDALRREGGQYRKIFNNEEIKEIQITGTDCSVNQLTAFAEGLALSHYQFLKYFTEKKENSLEQIQLIHPELRDKQVENLDILIQSVYKTRDLVNEPLSYLTAEQLSKEISLMGEKSGFRVEVLNHKQIESLKMGGLLAVNKGSIDPPTFTILEYKSPRAINTKPYVLVGKGVVFDTGGLSLKPTTDSMDYMKSDMGGAAVVAGTIQAIAQSSLPIHIIGLIPATDNRPDGNAYAPGDVITMYDGTTVEVLNTDAEGRMILADALSYARQYNPELVIDLATLTGAAWVAIGTQGMVGMGNANKEVMDELIKCGAEVHERIAEFPFWDDYKDLLKSDIADLKNIGGRLAGAITAGKFLEHFTDYPYIHLDIAGPAYLKKNTAYIPKGGSGTGVRLLYHFFSKLCKSE